MMKGWVEGRQEDERQKKVRLEGGKGYMEKYGTV
jgi:hypothetical protein